MLSDTLIQKKTHSSNCSSIKEENGREYYLKPFVPAILIYTENKLQSDDIKVACLYLIRNKRSIKSNKPMCFSTLILMNVWNYSEKGKDLIKVYMRLRRNNEICQVILEQF